MTFSDFQWFSVISSGSQEHERYEWISGHMLMKMKSATADDSHGQDTCHSFLWAIYRQVSPRPSSWLVLQKDHSPNWLRSRFALHTILHALIMLEKNFWARNQKSNRIARSHTSKTLHNMLMTFVSYTLIEISALWLMHDTQGPALIDYARSACQLTESKKTL